MEIKTAISGPHELNSQWDGWKKLTSMYAYFFVSDKYLSGNLKLARDMTHNVSSRWNPVDMQKSNEFEHPILDLIKNRRSSRAFSKQPIALEKISSLFEATRWAPSSTNEQPWIYLYATQDQPELWNKLFSCLNDSNKIWAKDAPLLILSLARKKFSSFIGANAHAMYDLGGANSFLTLQAVELGLQVRQMAGFNYQKTIEEMNIPVETHEVGVFIAVGYPGDPQALPENLKLRELAPRERFLQQEFVMNKTF